MTLLQYVLIVVLVFGVGYFFYLLKEKGEGIDENYYGITYSILDSLLGKEVTPENVKNILRIVSENVNYVEENMNELVNQKKEDRALSLIKETLKELNFQFSINDDKIRCLIRLACGFMIKDKN